MKYLRSKLITETLAIALLFCSSLAFIIPSAASADPIRLIAYGEPVNNNLIGYIFAVADVAVLLGIGLQLKSRRKQKQKNLSNEFSKDN